MYAVRRSILRVSESPADVTIEKGVLVVSQDHGSRDVSRTTYRFRYGPDNGKFMLMALISITPTA